MEIYQVKIETANCNYEINVNGFPIFREKNGYRLETHYNINHLLFDKSVNIQFQIHPAAGEKTLSQNVVFNISCNVHIKGQNSNSELFSYSYEYDESRNLPAFSQIKLVPISKIEHTPTWSAGQTLNVKTIAEKLNEQYLKIWELFDAGNLSGILEAFQIREKTYATSYGDLLDSRISETSDIYSSYKNDGNFYLYPYSPQFFTPKIYGNGKLACLEEEDGFPPIFYMNKAGNKARYIPVYFGLIDGVLKVVL